MHTGHNISNSYQPNAANIMQVVGRFTSLTSQKNNGYLLSGR